MEEVRKRKVFTLLPQGSSRGEMYIRLSSDSASRQTPLPLAKFFPLPGDFGTFTLENVRSPGAPEKQHAVLLLHRCVLSFW